MRHALDSGLNLRGLLGIDGSRLHRGANESRSAGRAIQREDLFSRRYK